MIKAASLHTFEIDDPDGALEEIRKQLSEKLVLLKNTTGILQCGFDFIESGVASHICANLPFPIVGSTTISQAVNGAVGELMLTILVLTSDDAEFVPAHTEGHRDDFFGSIERSFRPAYGASSLPLKLILTFPPIIEKYSGDEYAAAFDRLCGNVPVFGSLAVEDDLMTYTRNATFCGGGHFAEEMSYLLIFGDVSPRFFVATVPERAKMLEAGVITKAEKNVMHEVNGESTMDCFERIGLAQGGVLRDGVEYLPLMLSRRGADGRLSLPFARGVIGASENGSILCRGTIYPGSSLAVCSNSVKDIVEASEETTRCLNAEENVQAALIYSCTVRRTILGGKPLLELERVRDAICPDIPFMMAYSGGEFCPAFLSGTTVENRFHNFSFIVCVF